MNKKLIATALCVPMLLLAACNSDETSQQSQNSTSADKEVSVDKDNSQTSEEASKENLAVEGYILKINKDSMRVVSGIESGTLMGKDEKALQELLNGEYADKGYLVELGSIDEKKIASLKVGQKVTVTVDQPALNASSPPTVEAKEIQTMNEE